MWVDSVNLGYDEAVGEVLVERGMRVGPAWDESGTSMGRAGRSRRRNPGEGVLASQPRSVPDPSR